MALWQTKLSIGSGAVAALLVVSAQGLFALTDSFAPFVADDMSIWQFQAIRAALMLPVAFTVAVIMLAGMVAIAPTRRAVMDGASVVAVA